MTIAASPLTACPSPGRRAERFFGASEKQMNKKNTKNQAKKKQNRVTTSKQQS